MKKLLSFILAFVFVICQVNVVSVASYDETDCVSLDKFTGSFVDLVENAEFIVSDKGEEYLGSADGAVIDDAQNTENNETTETPEGATNRLIVKSTEKLSALDSVGYVYGYNDLHILQFDNRDSFQNAYEYYDSLKCVEYVEEDLYLTEAVVDDGFVFESAIEYPTIVQSNLFGYSTAKKNSDGNKVDIGVIDSGVQHDHEFLAGRVVDTGFNSISDNGTAYDDRGHGTHVAGIIVANTLSNVTVYSYKALNSKGSGTATQVSLAIDAAIEDGMDIINLSVQMQGSSDTLHDAVKRADAAGVIVVAAAGNAGVDFAVSLYSPGCFEEVISVMSCSNQRRVSEFSNYGAICDFAAPGENILSTYLDNTYKMTSGTSMASPFICAAVSYELAKNNNLTTEEVCKALLSKSQICYGEITGNCVYPDVKVSLDGVSGSPVFEFDSCRFAGSMLVTISCPTENSTLLYSLNGEKYREYKEPIYITSTSTISAFSITDTLNLSDIITKTYTCVSTSLDEFVVDDNNTIIGYNGTAEYVYVPAHVNSKVLTGVGSTAFAGNTTVKDIFFENSVTHIYDGAFMGCTALESINANNVVYIGADAFNGCSALVKADMFNTTYIGDRAFMNCNSVQKIYTENVENVGENALKGCASLAVFSSDYITEFDLSMLEGCVSIQSILLDEITALPDLGEAQSIAEYMPSLQSVSFNKVTDVPASYFKGCSLLYQGSFQGATSIGDYAFYGTILETCYADSVKEIGTHAFENTCVDKVNYLEVISIGDCAFYNCQSITEVALPSLTTLGESAFYNCTSIEVVSLNKVTDISANAFYNNTVLENVSVSSACKSVGNQAFMYCTKLEKINLSTGIAIGDRAFYGCSLLYQINLFSPSSIGTQAFTGTKNPVFDRLTLNNLTYIGENAFEGLTINSLILEKVEELNDIPENCITLVGGKATICNIPKDRGSAVVYSPAGTYCSEYCIENGINYVEYNASTAILEQPRFTSLNNYIYFNVIGFNLSVELYGCKYNTDSTNLHPEGSSNESGRIYNTYYFYPYYGYNRYKYYYFIITSKYSDGSALFSSFRSDFVENPNFIPQISWKITDTSTVCEKKTINKISTEVLVTKKSSVEECISSISVTNGTMSLSPSMTYNGVEMFGTGSVVTFYNTLGEIHAQYPIILCGDVNSDGAVDAIDCSVLADFMYSRGNFKDDMCKLAGDYNGDNSVNVVDYQYVVNNSIL